MISQASALDENTPFENSNGVFRLSKKSGKAQNFRTFLTVWKELSKNAAAPLGWTKNSADLPNWVQRPYMDTARGEVCSKRKAFVIEIRYITNFHLGFGFILDFCIKKQAILWRFLCFAWSVHFALTPFLNNENFCRYITLWAFWIL